ncbi:MAG: hypothetical protein R3E66_09010 [bacterium]
MAEPGRGGVAFVHGANVTHFDETSAWGSLRAEIQAADFMVVGVGGVLGWSESDALAKPVIDVALGHRFGDVDFALKYELVAPIITDESTTSYGTTDPSISSFMIPFVVRFDASALEIVPRFSLYNDWDWDDYRRETFGALVTLSGRGIWDVSENWSLGAGGLVMFAGDIVLQPFVETNIVVQKWQTLEMDVSARLSGGVATSQSAIEGNRGVVEAGIGFALHPN